MLQKTSYVSKAKISQISKIGNNKIEFYKVAEKF